MADHLAGAGVAVGLRIVDVAGQRIDEIAGEVGAIGGRQCGPLLALEVIVQDQLLVVLGKDEVDARPLEVAVEEQLCVGNDDRARRSVGGMRGDGLDMAMLVGMQARAVSGKLAVEFTGIIQWATAKG